MIKNLDHDVGGIVVDRRSRRSWRRASSVGGDQTSGVSMIC